MRDDVATPTGVGVVGGEWGWVGVGVGGYIFAAQLQKAGAVKSTKNRGGKILGCLKMVAVN